MNIPITTVINDSNNPNKKKPVAATPPQPSSNFAISSLLTKSSRLNEDEENPSINPTTVQPQSQSLKQHYFGKNNNNIQQQQKQQQHSSITTSQYHYQSHENEEYQEEENLHRHHHDNQFQSQYDFEQQQQQLSSFEELNKVLMEENVLLKTKIEKLETNYKPSRVALINRDLYLGYMSEVLTRKEEELLMLEKMLQKFEKEVSNKQLESGILHMLKESSLLGMALTRIDHFKSKVIEMEENEQQQQCEEGQGEQGESKTKANEKISHFFTSADDKQFWIKFFKEEDNIIKECIENQEKTENIIKKQHEILLSERRQLAISTEKFEELNSYEKYLSNLQLALERKEKEILQKESESEGKAHSEPLYYENSGSSGTYRRHEGDEGLVVDDDGSCEQTYAIGNQSSSDTDRKNFQNSMSFGNRSNESGDSKHQGKRARIFNNNHNKNIEQQQQFEQLREQKLAFSKKPAMIIEVDEIDAPTAMKESETTKEVNTKTDKTAKTVKGHTSTNYEQISNNTVFESSCIMDEFVLTNQEAHKEENKKSEFVEEETNNHQQQHHQHHHNHNQHEQSPSHPNNNNINSPYETINFSTNEKEAINNQHQQNIQKKEQKKKNLSEKKHEQSQNDPNPNSDTFIRVNDIYNSNEEEVSMIPYNNDNNCFGIGVRADNSNSNNFNSNNPFTTMNICYDNNRLCFESVLTYFKTQQRKILTHSLLKSILKNKARKERLTFAFYFKKFYNNVKIEGFTAAAAVAVMANNNNKESGKSLTNGTTGGGRTNSYDNKSTLEEAYSNSNKNTTESRLILDPSSRIMQESKSGFQKESNVTNKSQLKKVLTGSGANLKSSSPSKQSKNKVSLGNSHAKSMKNVKMMSRTESRALAMREKENSSSSSSLTAGMDAANIAKFKKYIKLQEETEKALAVQCVKTEATYNIFNCLENVERRYIINSFWQLKECEQSDRIEALERAINGFEFRWELYMTKCKLALVNNSNKVSHLEETLSYVFGDMK